MRAMADIGCTTRIGSAWRFEYVRSILRQAA
jgi:hypothetical protein